MCILPSSGSLVIKALLVENSFHLKESDKEMLWNWKDHATQKDPSVKGKAHIL